MSEETTVKAPETAVPQTGVDTQTAAPQSPTNAEVDLAAELVKTQQERENYKRGMLKAKGKLPEDDEITPELIEDIVSKKVQEALDNKKDAEYEAREKALTAKLIKENQELKLATQNRSQVSSGTGQGASIDSSPQVKTTYFSEEQLAELKKRGVDPEKVKENILKRQA